VCSCVWDALSSHQKSIPLQCTITARSQSQRCQNTLSVPLAVRIAHGGSFSWYTNKKKEKHHSLPQRGGGGCSHKGILYFSFVAVAKEKTTPSSAVERGIGVGGGDANGVWTRIKRLKFHCVIGAGPLPPARPPPHPHPRRSLCCLHAKAAGGDRASRPSVNIALACRS